MITNHFRNARMFTLSLALLIVAACETGLAADPTPGGESTANPEDRHIASAKDDGYRGIWFTLGQKSEFGDKYSGGLGTYTANHVPIAIYAPQVQKTFFVYGGAKEGRRYLLAMASYYDHQQRQVPRPTIVHDKQGVDDPHDDPSLALDEHGHLWVFVSGRGQRRPGFVYRSVEPYSTDAFERILEDEFTYPQPWWIEGQGFLHLFTRYTRGRELYFALSPDGRTWSEPTKLAGMGGHYQVSNAFGKRIITGFMMHPGGNVDRRTNLYYAETSDMSRDQTMRHQDEVIVSCSRICREIELLVKPPGSRVLLMHIQQEQRHASLDSYVPRFGNQVAEDLVRITRRIIGGLTVKPNVHGQLRDDQEVDVRSCRGRPAATSLAQRAESDQLIVAIPAE
jgi:hypothetical protein